MIRWLLLALALLSAAAADARPVGGQAPAGRIGAAASGAYMGLGPPTRLNQGVFTATAGHESVARAKLVCWGRWAPSRIIAVWTNWYVSGLGGHFPETLPGNARTIDWAFFEYPAGTRTAITFNGATSLTQADGATDVNDPVAVTVAANDCGYLTFGVTVATGGQHVTGIQGMDLGNSEGALYSATTYPSSTTFAAISGSFLGGAFANAPEPSVIVGDNWNGSPVALVTGDSGCAGTGSLALSRGVRTFPEFGLDDNASSPRMSYVSLCVNGTKASNDSAAGEWNLRCAIFSKLPNIPVTFAVDEHISNNGTDSQATLIAEMTAFANVLKGCYPVRGGLKVWKTTITPRTTDSNNKGWSTVADQTSTRACPGAGVCLFTAALQAGTYDNVFAGYIDTGAMINAGANLDVHVVPGHASTTCSAIVANVSTTVCVNDNVFPLYANLTPGCGTATVDTEDNYYVGSITGTGPWTLSIVHNTLGSASKFVIAQSSGVAICDSYPHDGLHPGALEHILAGTAFHALKSAGKLR